MINIFNYFSSILKTNLIFKSCLFLLFFNFPSVKSQFFSLGQNPPNIKWQCINTDNFKVVFPSGFEKDGRYVATYLDTLIKIAYQDLPAKPHKFSVIIHANMVTPNALVTLLPKRSEFFVIGPQENEGVDWIDNLSVHEYRHIAQLSAVDIGFTKWLHYIFGELGWGGVIAATTPIWYLEGDAVDFETKHTNIGRGEMGSFNQEFIAQVNEQPNLTYERLFLDSYKQYRANHYVMGYFLNNKINNTNDSINNTGQALTKTGNFPLIPFPFEYYIKKSTGKSLENWTTELQLHQKDSNTIGQFKQSKKITTRPKNYVDYTFPSVINDSLIVAVKRSYDDIPQLTLINHYGKEKKLTYTGSLNEDQITSNDSVVVYSQKRTHPRWNYIEYQELWSINLQTLKKEKISFKTRYQSPTISKTGILIAVEITDSLTYNLIKYNNGKWEEIYKAGYHEMIYNPSIKDNQVIFIKRKGHLNELINLNLANNKYSTVIITNQLISFPNFYNNDYICSINYNKKSQIGLISKNKIFLLGSSIYGSHHPTVYNNEIIYTSYHSYGNQIEKSNLTYILNNKIELPSTTINKKGIIIKPDSTYEIKKYNTLNNLFNFHSWAPVPIINESIEGYLGASVFSQNTLSSSFLSAAFYNNPLLKEEEFNLSYSYQGFYPTITYGFNHINSKEIEVDNLSFHQIINSQTLNIGIENIYNGRRFLKQIGFNSGFEYQNRNNFLQNFNNRLINNKLSLLKYTFLFSWFDRKAKKNILVKRKISFLIRYYHQPNSFNSNNTAYFISDINIPVFKTNHGFTIKNELKTSKTNTLYSQNILSSVKGTQNKIYQNANKISSSYFFPITYPEKRIPYLYYLSRLSGTIGFEKLWELQNSPSTIINEKLIGFETSFNGGLILDGNFLRYPYPIKISIISAYSSFNSNKNFQWYFLPGISISY